ncbi:transposase [Paenibacillus thiaminolyticus]|uniref:transposase n=1 Tax=Paenibacillus thiaminolyticus TaxID=49283 RepID=UPI00234FC5EC|nr:transposase [Paenibacillus thiaminolyticus]WCR29653.1 transposase [Paenibacillus thiaminolyticus]
MDVWTNFGSLAELMAQFPTEESCIPALFALKWPHGFRCPNCCHASAYVIRTRRLPLYECSACRHQTSLTAGTILEGSRTSLRKWFAAIWLVSNPKEGINAVRLSSIINVTYKTAWAMLHKIRTAISCADEEEQLEHRVHGVIAFNGPRLYPSVELGPREQPIIVAASLAPNGEEYQYKMKQVNRRHMSGKLLLPCGRDHFAEKYISAPDSMISIIRQRFRVKQNSPLYTVFGRAQRWLSDTFRGVSGKYLQHYLDEFCYRENAIPRQAAGWEPLAAICCADNGARRRYLSRAGSSKNYARYLTAA